MAKQQQTDVKKTPSERKPTTRRLEVKDKYLQFKDFFDKSKLELKKTTWPTRKETTATCLAVVVLVILMSVFLGLVDLGLAKIVEAILY